MPILAILALLFGPGAPAWADPPEYRCNEDREEGDRFSWDGEKMDALEGIFTVLLQDTGAPSDTELMPVPGYASIEGSPALALGTGQAGNNRGHPVVIVATKQGGVFQFATDEDELSFVLAHELGHLKLGHPDAQGTERKRLFDIWTRNMSDDELFRLDSAGTLNAQFEEANRAALDAFQRRLEIAADRFAVREMPKNHYAPLAACCALRRAGEWASAAGGTLTRSHLSPGQRLAQLPVCAQLRQGRAGKGRAR